MVLHGRQIKDRCTVNTTDRYERNVMLSEILLKGLSSSTSAKGSLDILRYEGTRNEANFHKKRKIFEFESNNDWFSTLNWWNMSAPTIAQRTVSTSWWLFQKKWVSNMLKFCEDHVNSFRTTSCIAEEPLTKSSPMQRQFRQNIQRYKTMLSMT